MPDPRDPSEARSPAEDLLASFLAMQERGERVDIEEYCRAHPESANELRRVHGELFGLLEQLESLGKSIGAEPREQSSNEESFDLGPTSALSTRVLERLSGRLLTSQRYRIDGEVARGGMGSILLAWDDELRRQLAMKVMLQTGRDPHQREKRLVRFLEEAQITGQLDHPGVVPIHELGVDESGRVYFTMKLVRGRTLGDVFGERERDPETWTRTRLLEILLRICEAMAYAHSKGVVHRDLKPANVMVGRFGEVYVMDWGLARVQGIQDSKDVRIREEEVPGSGLVRIYRDEVVDSDASSPLYTMDGDVVGTPVYMAPEQARGKTSLVGPRADVYSVGAILYHMLAGSMPYVPPGVTTNNRAVLRRVRGGPPEPLQELAADVPAELVAICEKAMGREIDERYARMEDLAADLRAFIEGRVVRAYKTGALVELRKWVRRNRALAASITLGFLILIGGLGGVGYVQAKEGEIALGEARKAEASMEFLVQMLSAVNPHRSGREVTVLQVLEEAERDLAGYEGPELVRATLLDTLGITYQGLGELDRAREHLVAALEIRRRLLLPGHRDLTRSINNTGVCLRELGEYPESEVLLREASEMMRRVHGPEHVRTLVVANNLVTTLFQAHETEAAEELARETLTIQRRVLGDDDPDTIKSMNSLAAICAETGDLDDAVALGREACERSERVFGPDKPVTLISMHNLSFFLRSLGKLEEARTLAEKAVQGLARGMGERHADVLAARSNLGLILGAQGRLQEAEPVLREVLSLEREVLGSEHSTTLDGMTNLATVLDSLGEFADSEELHWECIDRRVELFGPEDGRTLVAKHNLGLMLSHAGRAEEAEALLREVLEAQTRVRGEAHPDTLLTMNVLAAHYYDTKRMDLAEELMRETVRLQEEPTRVGPEQRLTSMFNLGYLLRETSRQGEAEELWTRVVDLATEQLGTEHPLTKNATRCLDELRSRR